MYFHCIFHNSFVQNEHSNFDRSLVSILLDHHITVYRKRKKFLALVSGSYLLTGKSIMRSPVNSFHEYFIGFFRYFSERHSGLFAGTRTSWDMNWTLSLSKFIEMTWCRAPSNVLPLHFAPSWPAQAKFQAINFTILQIAVNIKHLKLSHL